MKAASLGQDGNPTGRAWTEHIAKEYAERYSNADSGQINGSGADELVLVDPDSLESRFEVFQVDADFEVLDVDGNQSDSFDFRRVAVGQIIEGGTEELAILSSSDNASLLVYEYDDDADEVVSDEDWQWAFSPQPEEVFLADISGNGDEEVFFLREFRREGDPLLIMRDEWGDDREDREIEEDLDDEEFAVGAGGDVDGDGRDEIIIMNDDRIRIYTRPDTSLTDSTIVELETSTDGETLLAGDLNKIGFVAGTQFAADKSKVEANLPTGTSGGNVTVQVTSSSPSLPITFNASLIPAVPWASLDRSVSTTPSTLTLRFNATNLQPGRYTTALRLDAQTANVANTPFTIAVELTVLAAALNPTPSTAAYIHYPCTDPLEPVTLTVRMDGTNGLNYRAAVMAVPAETTSAGGGLAAGIAGGALDSAGNMVLYDPLGNSRTIPMNVPASNQVVAASTLSATWPVDPSIPWITAASSDETAVPSILSIQLDPTVLGASFESSFAVLVLVADTSAGSPPENVKTVPILAMCASSRLALPGIR
jgi:hypothetical protein